MSDDFRDDDEREEEITEMDENDDREIIVEGLPKATDLSRLCHGGDVDAAPAHILGCSGCGFPRHDQKLFATTRRR